MAEPAGQHNTTSPSWRIRVCRANWKVLLFVWGTLVLGILINVVSSWLIAKKFDLGGTPLGWGVDHLWMMLLLLFLLAMLTLFSWLGSHEKQAELARPLSKRDRDHMLKRLHRYYEQILSQSLQGAVQMELGLAERPAAVQHALSLSLHLPDPPEQPLPPHLSIIQAYELAQRELLILGEPGAGKSMQLLELAHHLVEQAEQDVTQPLPIVLPLSSWATERPPLHDWLVEQVAWLYEVSKSVSLQLLQGGWLLPLLDGLDEVEESKRPACIKAINAYYREHVQPLVVCSRTNEYEAASTHERLVLHTAVVVQPLSSEQVHAYLEEIGRPVTALRAALKKNTELADLATTPLMLQVLILTYHSTKVRELSQKEAPLRQQIWADYVERMVSRKGDAKHYPLDVTRTRLSWLAQGMQKHNQTIFLLEQLQMDWLPKGQGVLYQLSTGLLFGLALGLAFGLAFFGLAFGLAFFGRADPLSVGPVIGLTVRPVIRLALGSVIGLAGGLFIGEFGLLFGQRFALRARGRTGALDGGLALGLLSGEFGGAIGFLFFGLVVGPVIGLFFGLGYFVIGWLVGWLCGNVQHNILRLLLWQARCTPAPWRHITFLNDATNRILLRRVGEGYQFTHRLLLDYFVDLGTHPSLSSTAESSTPSPTP